MPFYMLHSIYYQYWLYRKAREKEEREQLLREQQQRQNQPPNNRRRTVAPDEMSLPDMGALSEAMEDLM